MPQYDVIRKDQAAGTVVPYTVDLVNRLGVGETLVSATAALYAGVATGTPLSPAPTAVSVSGTKVLATVSGLTTAIPFTRLRWLYVTSAGRTDAADLTLACLS
jgi:hypothetical protein